MAYGSGLFTDFYELTMAQGYFQSGRNPDAVFEMFFRRQPFGGGYAIFAGLDNLLEAIAAFKFGNTDIDYLGSLGDFSGDFLDYLSDFSFTGSLYSVQEGSVVFPGEPLIRIHGKLLECQLLESLLLNSVNFQTLIATKTARICQAAGQTPVLEFGLRRAQGADGALSASRAAFIGGARATSNTLAGMQYGIPVKGTMAHSWVMSFQNEGAAFRAYAQLFPKNSIFLIDTYDTLGTGIQAAIGVGLRLKEINCKIGVRIDSGDLVKLSKQARLLLDKSGLEDAFIVASNDLDEYAVADCVQKSAPIDSWGVGTRLVTGAPEGYITGVYKLCEIEHNGARVGVSKRTDDPAKQSYPGVKQVYRHFHGKQMISDTVGLVDELGLSGKSLLTELMKDGVIIRREQNLGELQNRVKSQLAMLSPRYTRLDEPDRYPVLFSQRLRSLSAHVGSRDE